MTDEERAALRDEVESLTIRQAKALGEKATETLRILGELGLMSPATAGAGQKLPRMDSPRQEPAAPLTRCPVCTCAPGDPPPLDPCVLGAECLAFVGSPKAQKMTNKGPVGAVQLKHTLPGPGLDRAAMLAAPAFDADGNPIP
jgi:hypothetical protein